MAKRTRIQFAVVLLDESEFIGNGLLLPFMLVKAEITYKCFIESFSLISSNENLSFFFLKKRVFH